MNKRIFDILKIVLILLIAAGLIYVVFVLVNVRFLGERVEDGLESDMTEVVDTMPLDEDAFTEKYVLSEPGYTLSGKLLNIKDGNLEYKNYSGEVFTREMNKDVKIYNNSDGQLLSVDSPLLVGKEALILINSGVVDEIYVNNNDFYYARISSFENGNIILNENLVLNIDNSTRFEGNDVFQCDSVDSFIVGDTVYVEVVDEMVTFIRLLVRNDE